MTQLLTDKITTGSAPLIEKAIRDTNKLRLTTAETVTVTKQAERMLRWKEERRRAGNEAAARERRRLFTNTVSAHGTSQILVDIE